MYSQPISRCLLVFVCAFSAQAAQPPNPPEQKSRVGNWYYIAGTDGMFRVPRFVGAVHDTQARTSLIFTCQGRPGVKPGAEPPMMGMTLSDPIGARGATTRVTLRLDETPGFETTWITTADGESRLNETGRTDPLQLLFRIAGNKHRMLLMETQSRRLQFELSGASTVLFKMVDTCVKPGAGAPAKSPKKRRPKSPSK